MYKKIIILEILLLIIVFLNSFTIKANSFEEKRYSNATIEDEFSDDRVIVVLNKESSKQFLNYNNASFSEIECESLEIINKDKGMSILNDNIENGLFSVSSKTNYNCIMSIKLKNRSKNNVLNTIEQLEKRDDIIYVGPDYKIYTSSMNSSYSNNDENVLKNQEVINRIGLLDAWELTTGTNNIKVGVLDTGIDSSNPLLTNQIDYSLCRKFLNGSNEEVSQPSDGSGHGTMAAGIIASSDDNSIGMVGVAPGIKLVSLQIFDENDQGNISDMIRAISYADSVQIPILNISGGYRDNGYNDITALEYAIENYYGLIVCAAGNWGRNLDSDDAYTGTTFYPASSSLPNIISVGNLNLLDQKEDDSNYGNSSVDLFAYGNSITSTWPINLNADGYRDSLHGTSVSAPFVTGVAALILSLHPSLTSAQIKNIILTSVDVVPLLANCCVTGGRLNAEKAVKNALLHTYTYSYTSTNMAYHTCTCTCGYTFTENHEWYLINPSATLPRYACRYCQAITTVPPVVENGLIEEDEII